MNYKSISSRTRRHPWPAILFGLLVPVLLMLGCNRETPVAPEPETQTGLIEEFDFESLAKEQDGGLAKLSAGSSRVVELPAGSVDGLAAAIAAAGRGGAVIVRAGMHTESATVMITHAVKILGEPGAILEMDTEPLPPATVLEVGLHIQNAERVVIWGLDIRPKNDIGGTAILVDHSQRAIIGRNIIREHQFSVMLEHGDRVQIFGNTIIATTAWQANFFEVHGIVVANGDHVRIVNNDVSNAFFGVWACDHDGVLVGNHFHANFIGLILCKVPENAFPLAGGSAIGSESTAINWLAQGNNATGNFDAGYLVIDGANNNLLKNNAAASNGTYNIELAGDSFRFGFLTPFSFENKVVAGNDQVIIKNCGNDNTVIGGQLVDNGQDPCY